jgi:serine/threonine protein kinase
MISRYKVIEKIGAGGMGEVYLAEDTELNRKIALKFLPQHLCPDEDYRARFKREAQAVARLNHPNIITVHEVSEYQGQPYFAMELVEGQSLRELCSSKKLSIERIIELAIQICDGLSAAHGKEVVHRDIKPSNIIIDAYGRPKVLDFGLAAIRGSEQLTRTGSTLGTMRYMSPEQVAGKEIDQRSDLYSLGIVLYELITGRTPFERDNEAATLKAIAQDNPEPLARYKSDIPDELQRTVSKLLEKDPSLRYQSGAGVISDLKPLTASTKSYVSVNPTKRKNRWPLAIGGLTIITVLFVASIKFWPGGETEHPVGTTQERMMLAVLPFENLGAQEDLYFADGITEEITSRVAVLKGLAVIAKTSVLQYKGTQKRISEIGAELNVD